MIIEQIKQLLLTTDLTNQQIRQEVGCRGQLVSDTLKSFGTTFAKNRKRRMYRRSKLGDNNPMKGKTGEAHPNYLGIMSDGKGYWIVTKPDWYTGRKGSRHIFHHHEVYCLEVGLTEMPKGMVIHHCDCNKINNSFDNLIMMSLGDHMALHSLLEGATTISKESTAKWLEARNTER